MAEFFTREYLLLWIAVLALALFFPVRQLIWVLYIRRAQKRAGDPDEAERQRLRRRAGATSALVCLVFSFLYVVQLFKGSS